MKSISVCYGDNNIVLLFFPPHTAAVYCDDDAPGLSSIIAACRERAHMARVQFLLSRALALVPRDLSSHAELHSIRSLDPVKSILKPGHAATPL